MPPKKEEPKNLYAVLGLEPSARPGEIKSAYRRLALQFHPDKNPGDEAAAERFKEISIAYSLLSDPNKRHRYDLGETDVEDTESLNLDELGMGAKVFLSMLTRFGVHAPTAVTPKVLSEAQMVGPQTARALVVDGPAVGVHPRTQAADFLRLSVSEDQALRGICVSALSTSRSRFKLLLFDRTGQLMHQEDSEESLLRRRTTEATMFFAPFDRYIYDRSASSKASAKDDDMPPVFHQLDSFAPSRYRTLEAGDHLFAVYGDNFFRAASVEVRATTCHPEVADELTEKERLLAAKKAALAEFEPEFQAAMEAYKKAAARMEEETNAVDRLLRQREKLYAAYASGPDPSAPPSHPPAPSPSDPSAPADDPMDPAG